MRVLYIHQYFRRPESGGAIRSYYLAKSLVENGVSVDLITSHNKSNIRVENVDGINVHYLPVKYDNKLSFWARIWSFCSFMWLSYNYSRKIKNIDLVYASSTPLTVGITALLLKKINKIPYYFEVRDLWPEAPIQMGVINSPIVKFLLRKLEKITYKNSSKIIALSPSMKEGVDKITKKPSKTTVLSNISDCNFFINSPKDIKNTFYFGASDKFVVSYIGAIGRVNALESLLDVANQCKKDKLDNVVFIIAGRGKELNNLKSKVKKLELTNIRFVGFLNRDETKKLLNVTDASFISFENKPILETNSPNKFFDSIASGKICIVNNNGWIRDLIEEHKIGFYYSKNQPKAFVEKIKPYINNIILANEAKNASRELAISSFSRDLITMKFIEAFDLENLKKKAKASLKKSARA